MIPKWSEIVFDELKPCIDVITQPFLAFTHLQSCLFMHFINSVERNRSYHFSYYTASPPGDPASRHLYRVPFNASADDDNGGSRGRDASAECITCALVHVTNETETEVGTLCRVDCFSGFANDATTLAGVSVPAEARDQTRRRPHRRRPGGRRLSLAQSPDAQRMLVQRGTFFSRKQILRGGMPGTRSAWGLGLRGGIRQAARAGAGRRQRPAHAHRQHVTGKSAHLPCSSLKRLQGQGEAHPASGD